MRATLSRRPKRATARSSGLQKAGSASFDPEPQNFCDAGATHLYEIGPEDVIRSAAPSGVYGAVCAAGVPQPNDTPARGREDLLDRRPCLPAAEAEVERSPARADGGSHRWRGWTRDDTDPAGP